MRSEMVDALAAEGPWPEYAEQLMVFGRFVGAWDVDVTLYDLDGSLRAEGRGEWLFGWILEGRAVQDVLVRPPRTERAAPGAVADGFWEYGTTVRLYDPRVDAWHVTWIGPAGGNSLTLIARAVGDEIVLERFQTDGLSVRWVFSELEDDSARWRGSASEDGGETWLLVQEMRLRRRA